MEKRAFEEVLRFKEQCKINGEKTGEKILQELLANKKAGKGAGKLCVSADPKKVAMWIGEEGHHPIIWHMVNEEYQFASELHAQVAHSHLHSSAQKNRTWGLMLSESTNLEFPGASRSSARPRIDSRG